MWAHPGLVRAVLCAKSYHATHILENFTKVANASHELDVHDFIDESVPLARPEDVHMVIQSAKVRPCDLQRVVDFVLRDEEHEVSRLDTLFALSRDAKACARMVYMPGVMKAALNAARTDGTHQEMGCDLVERLVATL